MQEALAYRALVTAVLQNDVEEVKGILREGVDLGDVLSTAADYGRTEIAALLIAEGADVNRSGYMGMTPLMYAASKNHAKTVALLIENGAEMNIQNAGGWTALMLSAEAGGGPEAMRVLLDHGADASLRNNRGEMAYHIAERNCLDGRAQLLEEALFRQHEASVLQQQHADAREKQQKLNSRAAKPTIIRRLQP